MKNKIYIVGMGPGTAEMLTPQADHALQDSDVIVGYPVYLKLLGEKYQEKEFLSTPMKQEIRRCEMCFEEAEKGKTVSMVCSGDAGVYGMASLLYEMSETHPDCELVVVAGITAANSGAAVLGAPLNHDYCVISLSDLMTPWELIEKRLAAAACGDFCMAIYNPSSRQRPDYLKKACDILLKNGVEPERACGYVENIGRENETYETCTLEALRERQVNMFTTVFIGNSRTKIINGKLVTPRGYNVS